MQTVLLSTRVIKKKTEGIASIAYPTAQVVHMSTSVDWLTFNSFIKDLESQNLENGNTRIHHNYVDLWKILKILYCPYLPPNRHI